MVDAEIERNYFCIGWLINIHGNAGGEMTNAMCGNDHINTASKNVIFGSYEFNLHGLSDDDPYFSGVDHDHDCEFLTLCEMLIREDYICLDVGANIGTKSLFLARHASAGCVVSIEAAPSVLECLALNVEENLIKNVIIKRCAIGDKSGHVFFKDDSAYGHVAEDGVAVPMATLPDIVNELGLNRVDFIKIDVEGLEFSILKNSIDLINEKKSLVLFELNSWCQMAYGSTSPKEFIAWVLEHFSYVYVLRRNKGDGLLLDRVGSGSGEVLRILHQNLMDDGCVTDLLVTNAEWRLAPSPQFLLRKQLRAAMEERDQAVAERDQAVAERDQAVAELDRILASNSWSVTKPLREISRFLRTLGSADLFRKHAT
jgi:FkbM family methyltransferase